MPDRLTFWLLAATAFVAALSLLLVGLNPLMVLGLLHVPAVLMALLAMRAITCLAVGRSPALRVGSRRILDGWWSLLVPVLLLLAWTVGRETGSFSARISAASHEHRQNVSWTTGTATAPGKVFVPDEIEHATQLEIVGGDGVLHERFAAKLAGISLGLADHDLHGRIELVATPPFALLPLCKWAQQSCQIKVALFTRRHDTGHRDASLQGTIDIDGDWTMYGLTSQRDFHQYMGSTLGAATRKSVTEQLRKLADELR